MQSTGGPTIRFPEDVECIPASVVAWANRAVIEDPNAVENGGGAGSGTPLEYAALSAQVENLGNASTATNERVAKLEQLPVPVFGSTNISNGAVTHNFSVPSTGNHLSVTVIGGKLDDLFFSGVSGSVTATWTTAAGSGISLNWMKI